MAKLTDEDFDRKRKALDAKQATQRTHDGGRLAAKAADKAFGRKDYAAAAKHGRELVEAAEKLGAS